MLEPVFGQLCPCPNKFAFHFEDNYVMVGLVQQTNNLQFIDLRKDGNVLKKYTIKSNQSARNLDDNDKYCEIQILHQARFDKKLFLAATSHNNTIKVFRVDGFKAEELYSLENLPGEVTALESDTTNRKVFLAGKNFKTTLTLDA